MNSYGGISKKQRLVICQKFAKNKQGKCLSDVYINNSDPLMWQCSLGHNWKASWSNIRAGKWCPYCSKNKKLTLECAQKVAIKYSATLVSTEYISSQSKLKWICNNGHSFSMNMNAINSRGQWCPYCSIWSSEEICRLYLETIFNQKFIKVRPGWLINERGNVMELDGISEDIIDGYHIAFEHQGEQHYKKDINIGKNNYYNSRSLEQRQRDDLKKIELCKQHGVLLIIIPHLFKMTKLRDLLSIIENQCSNAGIKLLNKISHNDLDISKLYTTPYKIMKFMELVEKRGGICLSDEYVHSQFALKIKCNNDHVFWITPNHLQRGNWRHLLL